MKTAACIFGPSILIRFCLAIFEASNALTDLEWAVAFGALSLGYTLTLIFVERFEKKFFSFLITLALTIWLGPGYMMLYLWVVLTTWVVCSLAFLFLGTFKQPAR